MTNKQKRAATWCVASIAALLLGAALARRLNLIGLGAQMRLEQPHYPIEPLTNYLIPQFLQLASEPELTDIKKEKLPDGDVIVRFWRCHGETGRLQVVVLRREQAQWRGEELTVETEVKGRPRSSAAIAPKSGWESAIARLSDTGLKSIPDSHDLKSDGVEPSFYVSYIVEILDGDHYHAFAYEEPKRHKWPEAKQFCGLVEVLEDEFGVSFVSW